MCIYNICWIILYGTIANREVGEKTINVFLFKLYKVKTNHMFLNTGTGETIKDVQSEGWQIGCNKASYWKLVSYLLLKIIPHVGPALVESHLLGAKNLH